MSQNENNNEKLIVKSDEEHLLLDHAYDGIQELNHPLPNWWNGIFAICVVFAFGYFIYYQVMKGPTLRDEFKKEYAQVAAIREEFRKANAEFKQEIYDKIVADDGVAKGKVVYEVNCMPCHMENGGGDVGPNLTDDHWLIAKGTPATIHHVIFHGSEANGMPIWGEMISSDEIYQATAYVMTFHNTFVKGGKEPQGEKVSE